MNQVQNQTVKEVTKVGSESFHTVDALWLHEKEVLINDVRVEFVESAIYLEDRQVRLEPLLMELLKVFIEHRGSYLNTQKLEELVWTGRVVTDSAVRRAIKKLRDCLGDNHKRPSFIKTVPYKGYLFIPRVQITDKQTATDDQPTGVEPISRPRANGANGKQSLWDSLSRMFAVFLSHSKA